MKYMRNKETSVAINTECVGFLKNINIAIYIRPTVIFVLKTDVALAYASLFAVDSLTNIEKASPNEPLIAEAEEAITRAI